MTLLEKYVSSELILVSNIDGEMYKMSNDFLHKISQVEEYIPMHADYPPALIKERNSSLFTQGQHTNMRHFRKS